MTAITTRTAPADRRSGRTSDDALLHFAMRADATGCAGLGLLIAMAADPLSRLSGLSPTAEWIAGAGLVGYGAALYSLAASSAVRTIGTVVAVGNVVFAAVIVGVVLAGVLPLTVAGVVMMLATAAAMLGFAELQYLGVRRLA